MRMGKKASFSVILLAFYSPLFALNILNFAPSPSMLILEEITLRGTRRAIGLKIITKFISF